MTKEEAIMALKMVEAHGLADKAKRIAIEALSADVEEVVYCKDCRNIFTESCPYYISGCAYHSNDFCSYGRR